MRTIVPLLVSALLFSCSPAPEPDSPDMSGQDGAVEDDDEEYFDCNNVTVQCPRGYVDYGAYEDGNECTVGENGCVESNTGQCLVTTTCRCDNACEEFYFDECGDYVDCELRDVCGEELACVTCSEKPECEQDEILAMADPTGSGREEACLSDPALTYFCIPL